ncbi:hypothetical protein HDU91_005614 [Kappamyces sp. JEL0680]|nr:hypothetical protein HDU91_005614 [Kappamyces sp. JEL0680]
MAVRLNGPSHVLTNRSETKFHLFDQMSNSGHKLPLAHTLSIDMVAAVASAALTSPFITIIDKAIFSNASGKEPLLASVRSSVRVLLSSPHKFFSNPSFLWIWGVYSGTYIIANQTESICKYLEQDWTLPKFATSSVTNISLSIAKDRYFTRVFGTGKERPVPYRSLTCYGARDSATILASFILPDHVSQGLQRNLGMTATTATIASQLVTPCAIQIFSTPLHLYGMDYYNYNTKTLSARAAFIRQEYFGTVAAR